MKHQDKSKEELIKELQKLQQENNSLKVLYKKDITEHKQAVEALSLFRELIDKSNDTFEVLDSETGEFLDVNERGCIDLGYSREAFLSMSIFDIDPTLNLTLFQKAVEELHKSGALTWEGSHRRKDGSMFPVEVNIKSVQLDRDYIVTVVRDITTRKQAEAELLESQEKYSDLYETAPVGIYRTKIDGSKILEINNTLCEMLGFTKEEFLSQPSTIRWADPNRRNEIVEILKEHGVATNFDADILKKDGSRISCLLSMNIFKDEGYIEGFILDITDRMRAEDAVRQSRKELDTLFEASPELISFIGFDGYFKRLNPAWVKTLGYPMDKLLSIPFIEFIHPDDHEATNIEVAKLAGGQRTIRFDNRYRCNDGSYRWLSWSVIPDTKEKLLYAVARDITERKQSEELLKITLENLERSNKELEQFAYVASHDLQEPLRMVSSFTQLLERRYKDKLDQDANDFIQFAVDGANRMQKLINDLLDYSRISSRGKDFAKVDISQVLGQTISNLQQLIIENTAMITNEDLPELKADESQILRVFQNLIENALKFQKRTELPKIHISCKKKNDFYEFAVRDNGIGMDMQFHDRVFTIFQRLHSKEDYPGTGIGLSICKRIVERHGGKIWFESKENEGTTFYFTLKE